MAAHKSAGMLHVVLTPGDRIRYTRWWFEQSGLSREEVLAISAGMASGLHKPRSPRPLGQKRVLSKEVVNG